MHPPLTKVFHILSVHMHQPRYHYNFPCATIIKGKGRTHYGIATCVCYLAEAVLNQRLTIAPVSTMFQGEYGIEDVCLSVPSIIGVNGVEKRLEER